MAVDAVEMESALQTVHLYEITVDPLQQGETSLLELSDVGESNCFLQADLKPSGDGFKVGPNFPLTLFQTVNAPCDRDESTEVVVMSECLAGEGQDELMNGITAAFLTQGHELVMNESTLGRTDEAVASLCVDGMSCTTGELSTRIHEGPETRVIAYFETTPSIYPSEISNQSTFSPETVLSSALSSKPITSTLPIVSKHVPPPPAPVVVTLERLDTDEGEDEQSEEDGTEQQDDQLVEHW